MRNLNVLPVNRRARPREIRDANSQKQNRDGEQRKAHRQQRSAWNKSAPLVFVIIAATSTTVARPKVTRPATVGSCRLQFFNFENRRHTSKINPTSFPSRILISSER